MENRVINLAVRLFVFHYSKKEREISIVDNINEHDSARSLVSHVSCKLQREGGTVQLDCRLKPTQRMSQNDVRGCWDVCWMIHKCSFNTHRFTNDILQQMQMQVGMYFYKLLSI